MRTIVVMACALAVWSSNAEAQDVDLSACRSVVRTYYPRPSWAIADRADTFASQGEPAAAFLLEKLRAGVRDVTVVDIVAVFAFMKLRRTYDAEADTAVIRLLEEKVKSIRNPWTQEAAYIWLDMLRRLGDVGGQPGQG